MSIPVAADPAETPEAIVRCPWCEGDAEYQRYHDEEWGIPLRDDKRLFELLILEGAQAGLSWLTILRRRQGYRAAFDGFDAEKMARYDLTDIERLRNDPRIIRNRLKINAAIQNARAYLALRESGCSLADWFWRFFDGVPITNCFKTMADIPASTPLSKTISGELRQRGFTFIGPVIIYAFMQSAGFVNDHLMHCFCYKKHMSF